MQSAATTPDPFQLDNAIAATDRDLNTCGLGFVMIPNVNQELGGSDVFCGGFLNELDTATIAGKVRSKYYIKKTTSLTISTRRFERNEFFFGSFVVCRHIFKVLFPPVTIY